MLTNRSFLLGSAALALTATTLLAAGEAQARGGWHVHVEVRPRVVVQPYYPPPPPPPRYRYMPAPVYMAPAPAAVVVAHREPGSLGLSVSGVAQQPAGGDPATGGMALKAQYRASSHSLMLIEVQGLKGARRPDGLQRTDVAALLGVRMFPWNATLAPFFEVAGGFGDSAFRCCTQTLHSYNLVGRYALGLELRVGPHVVFEGQVGQIHRLNYEMDDPTLARRAERAFEVHGGAALRF